MTASLSDVGEEDTDSWSVLYVGLPCCTACRVSSNTMPSLYTVTTRKSGAKIDRYILDVHALVSAALRSCYVVFHADCSRWRWLAAVGKTGLNCFTDSIYPHQASR